MLATEYPAAMHSLCCYFGGHEMKKLILTVVVGALMTAAAWGQEWQHFQLTNFPPPGQVRECSSVADSLGNLHHFFRCDFDPLYVRSQPLFYLRTDFYGTILTDTVRLNDWVGDHPHPRCIRAMTDGGRVFCIFGEFDPAEPTRALYLTERNTDGEEVRPPTMVGYDGAIQDWNTSAVLDPSDSTIHVVGTTSPCYYYRFTTEAETLQWRRPINGIALNGYNTSMILSPADGRPWMAMYAWDGSDGHVVVVRFAEDTTQTAYSPLQGQSIGIGKDGFDMDAYRNSDLRIGSANPAVALVRVDSTFQTILDSLVISENRQGEGIVKTDAAGNCLLVWDAYPSLHWAFRRADGIWTHPLSSIDPNMYAQSYSIVRLDSAQLAFTCMGYLRGDDFPQLHLYTYGFPPNDSRESPRRATIGTFSVHPNPFGSSMQLTLPGLWDQNVVLYDILGRTVWSRTFPAGVRSAEIDDPRLRKLPSGNYYLALLGHVQYAPIQITHIK